MKLLLATHNQHKKEEFIKMFPSSIELISFDDLKISEDIEETGTTFNENAQIKSEFGFQKTKIPCFADDSGLVIEALNGEPGIYSARYAGTGNSLDNVNKVLKNLEGIENRKAYFISVISFTNEHGTSFFEGKIHGMITSEIKGINGFGYDPIFQPNNYTSSFAEMDSVNKNKISHRALAFQKFIESLSK